MKSLWEKNDKFSPVW